MGRAGRIHRKLRIVRRERHRRIGIGAPVSGLAVVVHLPDRDGDRVALAGNLVDVAEQVIQRRDLRRILRPHVLHGLIAASRRKAGCAYRRSRAIRFSDFARVERRRVGFRVSGSEARRCCLLHDDHFIKHGRPREANGRLGPVDNGQRHGAVFDGDAVGHTQFGRSRVGTRALVEKPLPRDDVGGGKRQGDAEFADEIVVGAVLHFERRAGEEHDVGLFVVSAKWRHPDDKTVGVVAALITELLICTKICERLVKSTSMK